MSDPIDRQAAIDALGDEPEVWTGKDEYAMGLNNQWHYDRNAIKAVPSAQSDLIAKIQNGIKATDADDVYSCGMRNGMRWCKSLIDGKEPLYENCPSAQPELHYDEWCADCKEYDTNKHCCPRWNRVIRQTLNDAQPEQQWIPVVKKPIEKGLMLVTYNDGDVDLLKQPTAYRRSDIVAWMPIEPWKGEENVSNE